MSNHKKTLLIIGGSVEAATGIHLARSMGYRIVVSDWNRNAPGFQYADGQILASTYDPVQTVEETRKWCDKHGPIDGVMCLATDVPHTVAAVAEAFGLPGIPRSVAKMAVDKLAMKEQFQRDGIPIPWFCQVESEKHLRSIIHDRGCNLVLKPVDSRGSRGVLRITPDIDLSWAYSESLKHSPSGRTMIEEFLAGPQVSTESIVLNGVAYTPGFADRNYEYLEQYAPYFIENGGSLPSMLSEETQQEVHSLLQQAIRSLGVTNGIIKGDIVVPPGGPRVIELATRLSGGYFCTHSIPLNVGVSTIEATILLALGETVDPEQLRPKYNRGVAQRYLFPSPGRIKAIKGVETARTMPGVIELILSANVGDCIGNPTDSNASAGMVLTTGEDRQQALDRVLSAIATIEIETEPV